MYHNSAIHVGKECVTFKWNHVVCIRGSIKHFAALSFCPSRSMNCCLFKGSRRKSFYDMVRHISRVKDTVDPFFRFALGLHVIFLVVALEYPSKTSVASLYYLPKKSVFWFELYLKVDPITHGHHLKYTLSWNQRIYPAHIALNSISKASL